MVRYIEKDVDMGKGYDWVNNSKYKVKLELLIVKCIEFL